MGKPVHLLAIGLLASSCSADGGSFGVQPPPAAGEQKAPALATIHDPVLISENGTFYLYSTGSPDHSPLRVHRSTDLASWTDLAAPFALPEWTKQTVPGSRGAWAPDISRYDDGFRLYYSVSTFGSQVSAIGLATSPTLDPSASNYGWTDRGPVITSALGDDYNAIDPNFVNDREGGAWLAFGSFWGGLMLVELEPATGLPRDGAKVINIARRPDEAENEIEAPFIFERDGWYYLLASFDRCCRGADSTYNTVIGRSRDIRGPYVDREGRSMLDGGGTVIASASAGDRFRGPGHAGHFRDAKGRDLLVFHAYDSAAEGRPTLRIGQLDWDAGWPELNMLELTR